MIYFHKIKVIIKYMAKQRDIIKSVPQSKQICVLLMFEQKCINSLSTYAIIVKSDTDKDLQHFSTKYIPRIESPK